MGVSNDCCPTCKHFLSLLTDINQPFIVRGSHNTVTACSLPIWTPEHIVDLMNEAFGSQLRQELIDFMDRSESLNLLHNHAHCTGLTTDVNGSCNELQVQPAHPAKMLG